MFQIHAPHKCFISSILSKFWWYAFHRQHKSPSSPEQRIFPLIFISSIRQIVLSPTTSANAYQMSILSIMNTVWTLHFFFEITATYILVPLNQIEVTSETWTSVILFGGIRSWWCNIRPSLRCPCTINWQFSLLAQLLFLSGASQPILLEVSALTECRLKQFSWAFGVGTPSPLTCLPIAGLFFLVPTTSKRLLRRLGHSIWACK